MNFLQSEIEIMCRFLAYMYMTEDINVPMLFKTCLKWTELNLSQL